METGQMMAELEDVVRCRALRTAGDDGRRCVLARGHGGQHQWMIEDGEAHVHYACSCILANQERVRSEIEVAITELRGASKLGETFTQHSRADDVLLELAVTVAGARGPAVREAWESIKRWYV